MQPGQAARQDNRNVILDNLAIMNLVREEAAIAGVVGTEEEPGLMHKVTTFVGLLVVTMHPAVWDRRRMALLRREGRVRTEVNLRNTGDENGATRHERRGKWVQRYFERVIGGDWVDSD